MNYINVHEAKTRLSKLLQAIEDGEETEITIARNGRPIAMLVPIPAKRPVRFGLAKGKFTIPDNIDRDNAYIERLFSGDAD
jgi:prevent-host-death family protein